MFGHFTTLSMKGLNCLDTDFLYIPYLIWQHKFTKKDSDKVSRLWISGTPLYNVSFIIFMKKTIFGGICSFTKVLTIFQHYSRKKTKIWNFFSIFKVLAPYTNIFNMWQQSYRYRCVTCPFINQDSDSYPKRYSIKTLHIESFCLAIPCMEGSQDGIAL